MHSIALKTSFQNESILLKKRKKNNMVEVFVDPERPKKIINE